jgi:hypothetical protein
LRLRQTMIRATVLYGRRYTRPPKEGRLAGLIVDESGGRCVPGITCRR